MNSRREFLIVAGLVILIIACYWQVHDHQFVNYDDHRYITHNQRVQQGLTLENVAWAFTTFEVANWHPITWVSHMLDVELFGWQKAGGHHLVNVGLHIANTVLLLLILLRMTGAFWRSALVAALFALHPLHVESVAWVSERKDGLSTFFGFLALLSYLGYIARPSLLRYMILLLLFALSLMSKPMFVTLPFVLLLLDYWPLQRFDIDEYPKVQRIIWLAVEKLPLLAMSIAISLITIAAQSQGGSMSTMDALSLSDRLNNSALAYATYLYQTLRPIDLIPFYPLPLSQSGTLVAVSFVVLIGVTVLVSALSRKRRHLLVGWLWYLGTLVPVIGLVQVGSQAHADRYTYVPLVGVFIMLAWSIPAARRRFTVAIYSVLVAIVLVAISFLTYLQVGYWRNSIVLSEYTLGVTPDNAIVHFNLANAYVEVNDVERALPHFAEAGRLSPQWSSPFFNMGNVLRRNNRNDEAIVAYQEAARRNPDNATAHFQLGTTLAMNGRVAEAVPHFQRAIDLDPNDPVAHLAMATALNDLGQPSQSLHQLQIAEQLALRRNDPKLSAEIARRISELTVPSEIKSEP